MEKWAGPSKSEVHRNYFTPPEFGSLVLAPVERQSKSTPVREVALVLGFEPNNKAVLVRFRNSHTIVPRSNYVELTVEKGLEFWTQEDTLPFIGDDEEWNADTDISPVGLDDLFENDLEHFSDDGEIPEPPSIEGESDTPTRDNDGETSHVPIGGERETPVLAENTEGMRQW